MTLQQLRKAVLPASVRIDAAGCVEIVAPDGHSFNGEIHGLVTDPQMHPEIKSRGDLYAFAFEDFGFQTILPCEDDCLCMEVSA